MRFCNECGMQMQDNEVQCPMCGKISEAAYQPQQVEAQPVKSKRKAHPYRTGIIVSLVCVLLIGGCGFLFHGQIKSAVSSITNSFGNGSGSMFSRILGQVDNVLAGKSATDTDADGKEIIFSGNIENDLLSNIGSILDVDGIQKKIDNGELDDTSEKLFGFFERWISYAFGDGDGAISMAEEFESDIDQAADTFMGLLGGDTGILEQYGYSEDDIKNITDAVQEKLFEGEYSEDRDANSAVDSLFDFIDGDMSAFEKYGYSADDLNSMADAVKDSILGEEYGYSDSDGLNSALDSILEVIGG